MFGLLCSGGHGAKRCGDVMRVHGLHTDVFMDVEASDSADLGFCEAVEGRTGHG